MSYTKLQQIVEKAEQETIPFWQVIIRENMQERSVSYERPLGK